MLRKLMARRVNNEAPPPRLNCKPAASLPSNDDPMSPRRRTTFIYLLVFSVCAYVLYGILPTSRRGQRYPPPRPSVYRHNSKIPTPEEIIIPPKRANESAPDGWRLFTPPDSFLAITYPAAPTVTEQLSCVEQWVAYGRPCPADNIPFKLDALWTWVNGSEQILSATRNKQVAIAVQKANRNKGFQPAFLGARGTHFRTHDEMVNSMRSVLHSLPPEIVRKYILLTADVSADDTERLRFGSVPTWLNLGSDVQVLHHSDVYRVPEPMLPEDDPHGCQWKDRLVPSFNSLAIESQFVHIHDLAPTIFYSNDDCFLLRPLSAADFETPLYGPVFRIQFDLGVKSRPPDSPPVGVDKEGEWPGLEYTNWLLDQRFGKRTRRYPHHVAKVASTPIMREVAAIWAEEIAHTAEARFRGHGPQVNLLYLTTWYTVEKHREALLYSFILLRVDADADGIISPSERRTLMSGLNAKGLVTISMRDNGSPPQVSYNLKQAKLSEPKETEYSWLSSDGYPLIHTSKGSVTAKATHCTIDVVRCFAGDATLALFRRVAFEKPECGDCLIAHLVGQSGKDGLNAFLPSSRSGPTINIAAEASTAKRWQDATYPSTASRASAARAIHRYSYAIGSSEMGFLAIRRVGDVQRMPNMTSKVAFFAVNDDMYNPTMLEQLDAGMRSWYAQRWGSVRGWWEQ
ncbi:hypothetical protein MKEN_01074900 [Mycena kentingensis (nom. inval.)]|nr:hypothetical protein MKEN_01074900 [Mycena kentingensis (nom. inval.)]